MHFIETSSSNTPRLAPIDDKILIREESRP
jgi:hypothetical protein